MNSPSFLILEDHEIMTESYCRILTDIFDLPKLVAVKTIDQAKYEFKKYSFDITIIDIQLGKIGTDKFELGNSFAEYVKSEFPNTKVVLSTSLDDDARMLALYESINPHGFLIKSDFASQEFANAITQINNGDQYFSPVFRKMLLRRERFCFQSEALNFKHYQLIILLKQGCTTGQLMTEFKCSDSTIERMKRIIREILDISNNENIVLEAEKRGFL